MCFLFLYKSNNEIKSIIPPKASFVGFSMTQHPYVLKLDTNRSNTFANSFIPMTSKDWNSSDRLPSNIYPSIFQNTDPRIPSTPSQCLNLFLFPRYTGPPQTSVVVPFWCNFFLYQYHYKKKSKCQLF